MNRLNIQGIRDEKIKIDITDDPKGIRLLFEGDIDMVDPSKVLDPLFTQTHETVIKAGMKDVFLDFMKLAFLNSSGIKAIAKWVMKLAGLPASDKYTLHIIQNKEITWQTTSLPTLSFLVPGAVKVE